MRIVMPPMTATGLSPPAGDGEALQEHAVEAGDQVDAGHDHGGGVDQGRHRRGAGHGVGQPGVQRELGALADHGDEQRGGAASEQRRASMSPVERRVVDVLDVEGLAGGEEQDRDADEQADVAGAGGEEGLEGGVGVRRSSSHQWPISMNEHRPISSQPKSIWSVLLDVTSMNMPDGEQAQRGEVVGVAAVAVHVARREDVHQQRDEGDDEAAASRRGRRRGCRPRP